MCATLYLSMKHMHCQLVITLLTFATLLKNLDWQYTLLAHHNY